MKRILIGLLLFAVASFSIAAQNLQSVTVRTLPNGMTIWLNEDHSTPKVYGAVVVKAGANDCPNTGIAHYFEHLLFKGTQKIGTIDYQKEKPWLDSIANQYEQLGKTKDATARRNIQRRINQLSIKAGEYAIPNEFQNLITTYGGTGLNAMTSFDETIFYNYFSPQYIRQWCELNSERLIDPVIRLFQGELETVYEEKNMYADQMGMGALEEGQRQIFAGTPYQYPIIGSTENLKNPSQIQMKAFYDKYYVAGNMGLILSGDFRADSIMPLLRETFGRIKSGPVPARPIVHPQPLDGTKDLKLKLPIPVVKAAGYIYRTPAETDPDYEAFQLAMLLLSNDDETGLLDSLENENKVMMAKALTYHFKYTGLAGFGFIPSLPFGSKKKADRLCREQIRKLQQGAFSDSTLQALKLAQVRKLENGLEKIETRKELLMSAFSHEIPWEDILARPQRIQAVTKADIMRVASHYLGQNYLKIEKKFGKYPKDKVSQPGYTPVKPKNTGKKSAYAQQLEKMPFQAQEPRFVDFEKDAASLSLGEKATLYAVGNPVNDLFRLDIIYRRGTWQDNRLQAVADYLSSIGTEKLSKTAFYRSLQALGATLNFQAGSQSFTITLCGFDKNFIPSLALLQQIMLHPKANKKMMKDLIKSEKLAEKTFFKDNTSIATAVLEKIQYGNQSNYIRKLPVQALKKMKGEDLIALFKDIQRYQADFVYSGTCSVADVATGIRDYLPLERIDKPFEEMDHPLMTYDQPAVYLYEVPNARQNVILAYQALPAAPNMEARARQSLWSHYFGGGMSSVMFQEIREFRAFAYYAYGNSIYPSLTRHPNGLTAFMGRLGTQADKSMLALKVLDSLFSNMPIRESNIAAAKQAFINTENNSYPNFRNIGNYIANARAAGYTEDIGKSLLAAIKPLGIKDLQDFYEKNVKGRPRILMVIGNPKTLNLTELNTYGKVIELKKEDIYR